MRDSRLHACASVGKGPLCAQADARAEERHAQAGAAFAEAAARTKNEGERAVLQRRAEFNRLRVPNSR